MELASPPAPTTPLTRPARLTVLIVLLWVVEGLSLLGAMWSVLMGLIQLMAPGAFAVGPQPPWMADYQREVLEAALPVIGVPLNVIQAIVSLALIWFAVECFRGRAAGGARLRSALLVAIAFVSLKLLWVMFTSYRTYSVIYRYLDVMVQVTPSSHPVPSGVAEATRATVLMGAGMGLVFAFLVFVVKIGFYLYARHQLGSPEVGRHLDPPG